MAKELRHCYSDEYVVMLGDVLSNLSGVSKQKFVSFVLRNGWVDLSLKQRMARLTDGLMEFLPSDYVQSVAILKKFLPEICGKNFQYDDMLAMFVPDYVVHKGFEHLQLSLDALGFFTSNGTSSEFAIRPFIIKYPKETMQQMLEWSKSDNSHIRRLASEGCRSRLPWAMSLPDFKKNPADILPVLENLKADDSKYVQKSVANNLNDIAKDNPQDVVEFVKRNIGKNKNTDWILKHGCRTLLKQGNQNVLEFFGVKPVVLDNIKLQLSSNEVAMGQMIEFEFEATIDNFEKANLRIEYAVDFMRKNGEKNRKIFKIFEGFNSSEKIFFNKNHKFVPLTTRKHYSGEHGLVIIINGKEMANADFILNCN